MRCNLLCLLVKGKGTLLQLSCLLQQLPFPFGHVGRPHSWRSGSSSLRATAVTAPAHIILFIPPAPPQLQAQAHLSGFTKTTCFAFCLFFVQSVIQPVRDTSLHTCLPQGTCVYQQYSPFVQCQTGLECVQLRTITRISTQYTDKGVPYWKPNIQPQRCIAPDAHQHRLTPQSCHRCPPQLAGLPALGGSGGWGHPTPGLSLGCCCALWAMGTSHEPSHDAGPSG